MGEKKEEERGSGAAAGRTRGGGGGTGLGTPGTNPRAPPPATRRIGYGMRRVGASAISAATAARRPSRISSSWLVKAIASGTACGAAIRTCGSPERPSELTGRHEGFHGSALEYESVCGICGIASSRGLVYPGRLAEMSATLVHRGPDSDGVFLDGGGGLAARRLSIIDLEGGDQPVANEDGTVHVVQNGEIYNHEELRREPGAGGPPLRAP